MTAPRTVLVADDHAEVRLLVSLALARGALAVVEAGDGDAALALARRVRPTLAVLDVQMPGPDGIEVCRALKADPRTAAAPVIILTAGADAFVAKPFSPAALLALVQGLLPP
jgi:CheY-like chemotaxis protein